MFGSFTDPSSSRRLDAAATRSSNAGADAGARVGIARTRALSDLAAASRTRALGCDMSISGSSGGACGDASPDAWTDAYGSAGSDPASSSSSPAAFLRRARRRNAAGDDDDDAGSDPADPYASVHASGDASPHAPPLLPLMLMSHPSARVREAAARSLSARVRAIPTRAPASAPALLLRVAAASRRRDDDGSVKDPNTEDDHGYYGSSVNDDNIPHEVASARALLETLRAAASGAAHPLGAPVALKTLAPLVAASGAFYTLVPIRPRGRGERRSLRTFLPGASLRSSLAINPQSPPSAPFNST